MTQPRTTARTPSATGLYWSERGAIGCAEHTPYEGTDTWIWDRWEPIPAEALKHLRERSLLKCETCGRGFDARHTEVNGPTT